jgi:tripartite-type tricarboxylate transporter receptor subunit TctC
MVWTDREASEMAPKAARLVAALCLASGLSVGANAQSASDFYKGKQIRMVIGHPVGGDYDIGGRLLAKYLSRHIPGQPIIVVQNMPAAGSLVAANWLHNQAPRDGLVFGSFSRNWPGQALMGQSIIEADPRRFNFIGATSLPSRICVNWFTSRVKSVSDLLSQELILAGSAGSSLSIIPSVLNHVLGTKFRVIEGYKGPPEGIIAMERGEVEGMCSAYGQFRNHEAWIREGKLRVFVWLEETPIPELPDVPSIYADTKTDEQRQFLRFVLSSTEFGRPYVMPPETPRERVETMRKAFADAVRDPELVAEAARMKLDMTYRPPEELERLVMSLYETPPAMVEAIKKLVPNL